MYLFFFFLGLGFFSVGILTLNELSEAIKSGYHAKGKIIDIKKKWGGRHMDVFAVIEFIDQNQQIQQATLRAGGFSVYVKGESVTISYYKGNIYEVDSAEYLVCWLWIIVGGCCWGGTLIFVVLSWFM
ncbi:DUF3592 domain-containing protein [Xanthocytophaga agilis]|uniref:DUF3592 domain-containing protein n=1 Tax=Xanthocytophaga agilis TaxID=3048010 RepID=A0AAE3R9M7_9BACT|nr:DUF3592 domain-containing protein [Xanthocytophaga agilis]MDJ1503317.1 hypothetical protein [Xanthocytophaga agilis]